MKKKLLIFSGVLLIFGIVFWQNCAKGPPNFPTPFTGSLFITAMDTATIDSFSINLDDMEYGTYENPCLLENIIIGFHKLFVYNSTSSGTTKTVEVRQDAVTNALFWLQSIGPYVGNTAPLFTVHDIEGNTISLENLRGKVVLLALFEHT
jgi:hypothetical protein